MEIGTSWISAIRRVAVTVISSSCCAAISAGVSSADANMSPINGSAILKLYPSCPAELSDGRHSVKCATGSIVPCNPDAASELRHSAQCSRRTFYGGTEVVCALFDSDRYRGGNPVTETVQRRL